MPARVMYKVSLAVQVEEITEGGKRKPYGDLLGLLPCSFGIFASETDAIRKALELDAQIEVDADCLTERSE